MTIHPRFSTFVLAAVSLALCGCVGMGPATLPDVTTQTPIGTLQGSDFGGHAPISGAHIFLLEAIWNGYATAAKSMLSVNSTATSGTYPVTEDLTSGSPTNGLYYVTSDANGLFNVTGDYTCDVGYPVYFYASGGSPGGTASVSITNIADSLSGSTYTYTFTAANLLYAGQIVKFSSSSLGGKWATLNGTTQAVLATPTTTSFQIATTIAPSGSTNTHTGTVASTGPANPAIVNLAMLGICPGVGNFTSTVPFVNMNEVSTAAMAYAMSGFATDGINIGTTTTNKIGLQNAALNAASLYNILGVPLELSGNSAAGEGQIANQATPAGNGSVPQAELDTVANILAACVDSANTSSSPSTTCTTLFADATTTGTTSGTKPIDTATAAINMSNNPGAANVVALWSLPSGAVPFSPNLSTAPRDFTVAITYANIATPGSIAIDASGNAYVPTNSSSGYVTELSPQGDVLATSASAGSGFDSIAVAPNGNVYVSANGSNGVYEFTSALAAVTGSPLKTPAITSPTSVAVDSSGNVYVTDGAGSLIRKFSSTGSLSASISNSCLSKVSQLALDPDGDLWTASSVNNSGCRVSNPGGASTYNLNSSYTTPGDIAVDSNDFAWMALQNVSYLLKVSTTGGYTSYGGAGGLSSPLWVAVDGFNNIWSTNTGNSYALSEFSNTGTALTGTAGYQGGVLNNPSFLAIDESGDVWIPNYGGNSVTELIGAAAPTVTPLSAQLPGVRP